MPYSPALTRPELISQNEAHFDDEHYFPDQLSLTPATDGLGAAESLRARYSDPEQWKEAEKYNDKEITNYIDRTDGHWYVDGVDYTQKIIESGNAAKLQDHYRIRDELLQT